MPRYMVQRTFTDGLYIPADEDGAKRLQAVGQANAALGRQLGAFVRQQGQEHDVLRLRRPVA